jgi:hypothetical protein
LLLLIVASDALLLWITYSIEEGFMELKRRAKSLKSRLEDLE